MANKMKYENQIWDDPIKGERLSTNSHYTGEHKGTPMQDTLGASTTNTNAHYVEENIVRYGTVMQDAIAGSTPTLKTGSASTGA